MTKTKKQSLNKKPIIAIIISGFVIAAIGAVLAFRGDIARFINSLTPDLSSIQVAVTEDFTSPDDWAPCQEVPKTVTATNNGSANVKARLSYQEYWQSRNGTMLPLEVNGQKVAVINFINQNDWELREDGYYYYKEEIAPGVTTSSFMQSVTFNCSFNITEDELYVCDENNNCETPANDYLKAKYHLRVTVEFMQGGSEFEWPVEPPVGCNYPILYNQIACQTNGVDTNLNFTSRVTSGTNGFGVNTLAEHANDAYPVYYFRGNVTNNFVVWGGFCWQAVRTTTTGGVKLIYAGKPSYSSYSDRYSCNNSTISTLGITNSSGNLITTQFSNLNYLAGANGSPAEVGYMYGDGSTRFNKSAAIYGDSLNTFSASGVVWNGSSYEFTGGINKKWSEYTDAEKKSIRYFCTEGLYPGHEGWYDTCPEAIAVLGYNTASVTDSSTSRAYGMVLRNGDTSVLEVLAKEWENVNDSTLKTETDVWFANNLANRVDDLEDTVYCNERDVPDGPLRDGKIHSSTAGVFNYVYRMYFGEKFTVDCSNTRDAFTVSESNGNGALRFPVGHITMDEAGLSGSTAFDLNESALGPSSSFLTSPYSNNYNDIGYWSMTPISYGPVYRRPVGNSAYMNMIVGYINSEVTSSGPIVHSSYDGKAIRPVVSLKKGTRYVSGNGTRSNPYFIP